mmetsp:Transcript_90075/g.263342  ORF Transcript_90075/g.263342 Transcript_90075/m.263342 type:complete len:348 (-) Transcript_90075:159-1202(-)
MFGGALGQHDGKHVDQDREKAEEPKERHHRVRDHVGHHSQFRQKAHHPEQPQDAEHPDDLEQPPRGAHLHDRGRRLVAPDEADEEVHEEEQHQDRVADRPEALPGRAEAPAAAHDPQQQLQGEDGAADPLHDLQGQVRLQARGVPLHLDADEERVHDQDGADDVVEAVAQDDALGRPPPPRLGLGFLFLDARLVQRTLADGGKPLLLPLMHGQPPLMVCLLVKLLLHHHVLAECLFHVCQDLGDRPRLPRDLHREAAGGGLLEVLVLLLPLRVGALPARGPALPLAQARVPAVLAAGRRPRALLASVDRKECVQPFVDTLHPVYQATLQTFHVLEVLLQEAADSPLR